MLITPSDMNIKSRGAITSSENSLEGEEKEQMPKFKTGSGARIDHLLYANSLVPFIHFPPPPVAKPDPPVAKGKRCKAASSSQPSASSASATTSSSKRGSCSAANGGNKKARKVDQGSESAVSALLALGGR